VAAWASTGQIHRNRTTSLPSFAVLATVSARIKQHSRDALCGSIVFSFEVLPADDRPERLKVQAIARHSRASRAFAGGKDGIGIMPADAKQTNPSWPYPKDRYGLRRRIRPNS